MIIVDCMENIDGVFLNGKEMDVGSNFQKRSDAETETIAAVRGAGLSKSAHLQHRSILDN